MASLTGRRWHSHGLEGLIPPAPRAVRWRAYRGGVAILKNEAVAYLAHGGWVGTLFTTEANVGSFMDLESKALEASESVTKIVDRYMERVRGLKGQLQNDAASVKASAERIEKEFGRMNTAMRSTIELMTSPEMEAAIANVERMARAIETVNGLKRTAVRFSVIEQAPPEGGA